MHRLRRWGRPARLTLGLIAVGVACLVVGALVIHGTPPRYRSLPGHGRVPIDETGTRDYLRLLLDVGGIVLVLYGLVRWNTQHEREPSGDEAMRTYGDSITDARTSVDPQIGMRPVSTDHKPR